VTGFPESSRVTFFDGQRLAASDLNGAAAVQRAIRWLHNASLHNWGVASGFDVTGETGDRQITVYPGYAIDALGRELILVEAIQKPVPARADDGAGKAQVFQLVAAYADETDLDVIEQRDGECDTNGAVRKRDGARIYWKQALESAVNEGIEVVLAQAEVLDCALAKPISKDQQRSARVSNQPYVAAGQSKPGDWALWEEANDEGSPIVFGLAGTVNTTAAAFGTIPQYQAQLVGPQLEDREPGVPRRLFLGQPLVYQPGIDGFTIRVLMPAFTEHGSLQINPRDGEGGDETPPILSFAREHWSVAWIGVEG
jgi:hypothetical protein